MTTEHEDTGLQMGDKTQKSVRVRKEAEVLYETMEGWMKSVRLYASSQSNDCSKDRLHLCLLNHCMSYTTGQRREEDVTEKFLVQVKGCSTQYTDSSA